MAHRSDPFIARFLARVPREIAASFTDDQLAAVQRAFGMRYTMAHAVDLRRMVRLPWGRYYLVLLAGRDRRAEGSSRAGLLAACVVGLACVAALLT